MKINTLHPKFHLQFFLIIAALFTFSSSLFAERTARIIYYKAPASAPEKAVLYQEGSKPVEVAFPRNNFSEKIALEDGDLVCRFLATAVAEGEKVPQGAPVLKIPEAWKKVVIFVVEDSSNEVFPVKFKAFDASPGVFGPGEMLFINFSSVAVFGYVGEEKLTVRPQETKVVKAPSRSKGDYKVKLDYLMEKTEKRQRFIRQTWRHDPAARQVVFVLPLPAPRNATYYAASIHDL